MTIRQNTVEYAFDTLLTNLATNTTLATSTRHDFTAITLYIPENTSRTFQSVTVEVTVREAYTAATSTTGWRIGIKLGAAAFSDTDVSQTLTNTGDHASFMFHLDVTSYFASNFGSGTSQTCQVGVAFSSSAAGNVNNITAKLYITYDYDDASQQTRVKTVRIPIEGNTAGTLTNTLASIGSNQIPNLNSFLPESSKTYREIWFEVWANDAGNATTDFNLALALDSETEAARATLEQGLNTAVWFKDIWIRNDMTTSATHDIKARASTTTQFTGLSIVLHVTYEYDHTNSSTILNSLVLYAGGDPGFSPTTAGTKFRYQKTFFIEEPTTITLVQSGILLAFTGQANSSPSLACGAQTARTYTITAGSVQSGNHHLCHRIDSGGAAGAGITLSRGRNTFTFDWYNGGASDIAGLSGLLYLNYTSGKASGGAGTHNASRHFFLQSITGAAGRNNDSTSRAPAIPETEYWLNDIAVQVCVVGAVSTDAEAMYAAPSSGEGAEAGWATLGTAMMFGESEIGTYLWWCGGIDQFKQWSADPNTMLDIETARVWRLNCMASPRASFYLWYTYHCITRSISGTISGSAGGTVNWRAYSKLLDEQVASGSRVGNGAYSFTWYDDTANDIAVYAREDSTHTGGSDEG